MDFNHNQVYILIDKYHTGQATHEELIILENWKKESISNQKVFVESISLLNSLKLISDWNKFDINHGWKSIVPRLKTRYMKIRHWVSVAAIFVLISLVGLWNYGYLDAPANDISFIDGSHLTHTTLKDGSELVLADNARIFTSKFGSDHRSIKTQGSYFINVYHNPESPFNIETSKANISVKGTSFHVEDNDEGLKVRVRDGKVIVKVENGSEFELTKNDMLSYSGERIEVQKFNNYDWGLFSHSYEDQSINKLIKDLTDQFVNFRIEAQSIDSECLVTSKFTQFTLLEVLEELSLIFSLDYTIKDGAIVVKDVSCK